MPEEPEKQDLWRLVWPALVVVTYLIVIFHPTQEALNLGRLLAPAGAKASPVYVTAADVLIGIGFVLCLIHLALKHGGWRSLLPRGPVWRRVPLPVGLMLAWMALSLVPALKGAAAEEITIGKASALKEVLQFLEYFVAAYLLFVLTLRAAQDPQKMVRRVALALCGVGALVVVWAWFLYLRKGDVTAMHVGLPGRFSNRNVLGGFLTLMLPVMWGVALWERSVPLRIGLVLVVVAGLGVTLAGGAFVAISVALLVLAYLRHRWLFVGTAAALALIALVALPRLPRSNLDILVDSVALYRSDDPYGTLKKDVREIKSTVDKKRRSLFMKIMNKEDIDLASDLLDESDYSWKWQQRYKDWQIGLAMMRLSPLFGVGVGAYEHNFNTFYSLYRVPKYSEDLMEPDALSFYVVRGAELGAPFLLLFLWLLLDFGSAGVRLHRHGPSPFHKGFGIGVAAALIAFAINSVFTDMLVRGVGVTFIILLALSTAASRITAETARDLQDNEKASE